MGLLYYQAVLSSATDKNQTFGICAILFGLTGIGIFFFVPETTYIRPQVASSILVKTGIQDQERGAPQEKFDEKGVHIEDTGALSSLTGNGSSPGAATEPKHSLWRSMRFYTGRYTNGKMWKIFARPFLVFFYPAVLFSFLLYGTTLSWIVAFSVVNGVLFTAPPYNFSVGETGLISLSPFILSIIGEIIAGPLNDWICLKLAARNRGICKSTLPSLCGVMLLTICR